MKKIILLFILLFFSGLFLWAEEVEPVWWGSNYMPWNLNIPVTLGYEGDSFGNGGLVLYPGAEMILFKPRFGDISPLDIGAAVRTRLALGVGFESGFGAALGFGVLATAHFGFKGIEIPLSEYLEKLDYFLEMGFCFDLAKYDSRIGFGFTLNSGFNYFLKPNFLLSLIYTNWRGFSGVSVGIGFKFGPEPEVDSKDLVGEVKKLYYTTYLAQFYSFYWLSFYTGGIHFSDLPYSPGSGTKWEITAKDKGGRESYLVERALLRSYPDGTQWWKAVFTLDGERFLYEFLLDQDSTLLKLRFRARETGELVEFDPKTQAGWQAVPTDPVTKEEYSQWKVGSERVRVKAGTFQTDHLVLENKAEQYSYEWWIAQEVPGGLVEFHHQDKDSEYTGELIEITRGNTTELSSF